MACSKWRSQSEGPKLPASPAKAAIAGLTAEEAPLRPALRPCPSDKIVEHRGKRLVLRPIRPDDEPLLITFVQALSPQDRRLRFVGTFRELSHELAVRLTKIDYHRQMAFLLLDGATLLGVGRLAGSHGSWRTRALASTSLPSFGSAT